MKVLVGFEWAVLVGILVAMQQIRHALRAVIADATAINMMKQYEHRLWDPQQ